MPTPRPSPSRPIVGLGLYLALSWFCQRQLALVALALNFSTDFLAACVAVMAIRRNLTTTLGTLTAVFVLCYLDSFDPAAYLMWRFGWVAAIAWMLAGYIDAHPGWMPPLLVGVAVIVATLVSGLLSLLWQATAGSTGGHGTGFWLPVFSVPLGTMLVGFAGDQWMRWWERGGPRR